MVWRGSAARAEMETMLTMRPPPPPARAAAPDGGAGGAEEEEAAEEVDAGAAGLAGLGRCGRTACVRRKVPRPLRLTRRSQSSSVWSARGLLTASPALLTRMSTVPP